MTEIKCRIRRQGTLAQSGMWGIFFVIQFHVEQGRFLGCIEKRSGEGRESCCKVTLDTTNCLYVGLKVVRLKIIWARRRITRI
jgi:hypothetical protein